jgi:hypothetical protein
MAMQLWLQVRTIEQHVVQQPAGGVLGRRVAGGGQGPGVLADQVMEPVPAAGGLATWPKESVWADGGRNIASS